MRFLFLILFFGISFSVLSQNIKNKLDSEGRKNGIWKEFYEDGKLRSKGKYSEGEKNGSWIYYDAGGKVEKRERYRNKKLKLTLIYKKGKLIEAIDDKGRSTKYPECGC